jgi:hypothetical protein
MAEPVMTTGMGMNESTGQQGYDWGNIFGSGLGAAGSWYAGNQGNKTINSALGSQTASAGQANQTLAPYAQVGQNAIGALNKMMQPGYDITGLPGYMVGQQEGEKAINRGLAARGNFGAGGSIPALSKFNQGYAQKQYGNEFNRLSSLLNVGQNAANAQAGIYQGLGNAQGAAGIAGGNLSANSTNAIVKSLSALLGSSTGKNSTVGGNLAGGLGSLIGSGASAAGNWLSDLLYNYDGSYTGAQDNVSNIGNIHDQQYGDVNGGYYDNYTPSQTQYDPYDETKGY